MRLPILILMSGVNSEKDCFGRKIFKTKFFRESGDFDQEMEDKVMKLKFHEV